MGTTRIKVIDLSSDKQEIKTSRKRAEKLTGSPRFAGEAGAAKIKEEKVTKEQRITKKPQQPTVEKAPAQQTETPAETIKAKVASSAPTKKIPKTIQKHHLGKKYKEAKELIDQNQNYSPKDAIGLLYKTSYTKFDPTVEIHLNVVDKNVKTTVNFPHAVGGKTKEKKFLIFSEKQKAIDNQPVLWGNEQTITEIESQKLKPRRDFDVVISSPKFMPTLAKIAKILGPAGLMPNPKNGTVTDDWEKLIGGSKQEGTEFRTDPTAPIIHTKIGKLSDKPENLEENLKALIFAIGPAKIQKAIIKSTMSPAIKLDISAVTK